jgi:hypothetical protein
MFMARSAQRRALPVAWSLAAVVLGGAVGLAGGCSNDGSYQVSWQFTKPFASGACGKAGVSAIAIAASDPKGGLVSQVAPCGPGMFTGKLSDGTWTLALTALDAEGQEKEPAASGLLRGAVPAPIDIKSGELTVVQDPVVLPPLPECRDGVDNDNDGRVDLDDPDCGGDPQGTVECVAGSPGCLDTTP